MERDDRRPVPTGRSWKDIHLLHRNVKAGIAPWSRQIFSSLKCFFMKLFISWGFWISVISSHRTEWRRRQCESCSCSDAVSHLHSTYITILLTHQLLITANAEEYVFLMTRLSTLHDLCSWSCTHARTVSDWLLVSCIPQFLQSLNHKDVTCV